MSRHNQPFNIVSQLINLKQYNNLSTLNQYEIEIEVEVEINVVNLRENGFLKNSHRDGKSRGERVLKG